MKHLENLQSFREELARISLEVEIASSMQHFDIHKVCEDLFCSLFRHIFGYKDLRNLNKDHANYPAIDLADDRRRVAFQITSDGSLDKVKDSLTKFIKADLNVKYDRLIVFVITRKQNSYSQSSIDGINGGFNFNAKRDILDHNDIGNVAASIEPASLASALECLHSYTVRTKPLDQTYDPPHMHSESLMANLLEIYFPQSLYIADLIPEAIGSKKGIRMRNQRRQLRNYLQRIGIRLPSDYEVSGGKLITFHDIEDNDNPFSALVDRGTITPLNPSDFYQIDSDHERIFKSLLRFCLQTKLYSHRVLWKHLDRVFIFLPIEDSINDRKENWMGRKKSTRTVFVRKFNRNDASKVLSVRHLAFQVEFHILDSTWFMSITPDWFFSFGDNYQRSFFGDKLLSGLKRMEKNRSVYNQFRFISDWLRELDSIDLFREGHDSPTLSFGDTLVFDGTPLLNEALWAPVKSELDGNAQAYDQLDLDFNED